MSHSVDSAQEKIVEALRTVGATVHSTAMVGGGFPDLVVGFRGVTYLLEVKTPEPPRKRRAAQKRALRKSQTDWIAAWRGGPVAQVETPEQALAAIGIHARSVVSYTPPPGAGTGPFEPVPSARAPKAKVKAGPCCTREACQCPPDQRIPARTSSASS